MNQQFESFVEGKLWILAFGGLGAVFGKSFRIQGKGYPKSFPQMEGVVFGVFGENELLSIEEMLFFFCFA